MVDKVLGGLGKLPALPTGAEFLISRPSAPGATTRVFDSVAPAALSAAPSATTLSDAQSVTLYGTDGTQMKTTLGALKIFLFSSTSQQPPPPPPAPTLTTIQSASLAADGLTLTLTLSQPATIAGTLALLVGGTGRSVTWTTPGTASATRTGTLAGVVQAGQVVTFSAATGFTSPALAAAISGRAVTNASTVAAAPPVDTTPTLLASFAGAAGTQPTGANALTFAGVFGTAGASALDGNGNYRMAPGCGIAFLAAAGVRSNGSTTITLASPGKLGFAFKMTNATGTASGYFNGQDGAGHAFLGTIAGGGFEQVKSYTNTVGFAATTWEINQSGNSFKILGDGAVLLDVTDTEFTADGFLGFRSDPAGVDPVLINKIEFLSAAQANTPNPAPSGAPTMTIIGVS